MRQVRFRVICHHLLYSKPPRIHFHFKYVATDHPCAEIWIFLILLLIKLSLFRKRQVNISGTFWNTTNHWNSTLGTDYCYFIFPIARNPDNKAHRAYMSAPGGPHVGPMNLAIRDVIVFMWCAYYLRVMVDNIVRPLALLHLSHSDEVK